MAVPNNLYYWRVYIQDEVWIVDAQNIKEVYNKVMLEDEDATIEVIERMNDVTKIIL